VADGEPAATTVVEVVILAGGIGELGHVFSPLQSSFWITCSKCQARGGTVVVIQQSAAPCLTLGLTSSNSKPVSLF
jgi:hypothetical protein